MRELRDRILYPRAGWLSLGLLAVMALSIAWAVQGAGWLEQLDYLAPLAVWAVVIGAVVGVLRLSIVFALPLGALSGAVIVIWMIGGEYHVELSQLGRLFALRTDLIEWTRIVLDEGYPPQMAPYALGLGILMWTAAFTASYVVYRYHRVLDAILLLAAALIINLSATLLSDELIGHLLLFVVAALLLWLRAALVTRQDGWQRRRVNETLEVPAAIMRSGIVFGGAAVVLAWALTSVAVAAPLTGAWRNLDGVWEGVRDQFEGVFGSLTNPQSRITGDSFGQSFTVFGEWVSSDDPVLILAAERPLYLRTFTYDHYNGKGFELTPGDKRTVAAGTDLFDEPTSERPTEEDAVRLDKIAIEMQQSVGRDLFTAGSPLQIYAPAVIQEPDGQPLLGSVESTSALGAGEAYEVLVAVSEATEAELRVAGTAYPPEVQALYMDTTGVTDEVAAEAERVTEFADNPYDQAKALARYFNSDAFEYATVGPKVPPDGDLVHTFLFAEEGARRGYCQYFASAMAMMARSVGLPARVAVGFAPGESAGEGLWLSRENNAHAWVEIYFPGHGWQIFEATKTISPRFVRATGDPDSATPPFIGIDPFLRTEIPPGLLDRGFDALPSAEPVAGAIDPTQPEEEPADGGSSRTGNAVVMVVLVAVAAIFIWFQMRRSKRRWRLLPAGDRAWRQLTLAADRAGVGPRPAETIYEYAGWLEDQLPKHGEPIRTVADGKVWQSYSGRPLTRSGSNKLEASIRRLRRPMFLLALRRRLRPSSRNDGR